MAVSDWSTTPSSNNAAPPNGWPENQAPSSLNDTGRQMMADIRAFYDNAALLDAANVFTSATGTNSYPVRLSGSFPALGFIETDAAANNKAWDFLVNLEQLDARVANDAGDTVTSWLTVTRTGTTIDSLNLQASQIILTGAEFQPSFISPSALASGSTNDYAPTGFSSARIVRIAGDAAGSTLTGIAGGVANRIVTLVNVGSTLITLKAESASSTAANRFGLSSDAALSAGYGADIWYDGTSSRWRVLF